jgi:replication initiation and membrane attachment protein
VANLFYSDDPKQPFYVINQLDLTAGQAQILTKLYQPLIGSQAAALYFTLAHEYSSLPLASDYCTLLQLETELDCGLRPIFEALHKLEAVGLCKSYLDQNVVLGRVLKLKLLPVLSAEAFFDEFLLRSLLLEKVGVVIYKRLKKQFADQLLPVNDAKDVSAGFFDVFSLTPQQLAEAPLENKPPKAAPSIVNDQNDYQIDWQYLQDRLQAYHISARTINENRRQIYAIMAFYRYSADDFVDLVLPTLVPGKDELRMGLIEQAANQAGPVKNASKLRKKLVSASQRSAAAVVQQLDDKDDQLLQEVNQLPAVAFLEKVKQSKGGYVTAQERRVIFNLQNRSGLTPAMTNLVVKTCLDYDAILTQNRADRIANDWLQHGVTTTAAAIVYSKKFKTAAQRKYRRRTSKRVEQGTNWQQKSASHQSKVTPEQLQRLLKKQAGGSGNGTH